MARKPISTMQKVRNYFIDHPKEKIRPSELIKLRQFKTVNKNTVRCNLIVLFKKGFLRTKIIKSNVVYYFLSPHIKKGDWDKHTKQIKVKKNGK